jgi:hypothetical protein
MNSNKEKIYDEVYNLFFVNGEYKNFYNENNSKDKFKEMIKPSISFNGWIYENKLLKFSTTDHDKAVVYNRQYVIIFATKQEQEDFFKKITKHPDQEQYYLNISELKDKETCLVDMNNFTVNNEVMTLKDTKNWPILIINKIHFNEKICTLV